MSCRKRGYRTRAEARSALGVITKKRRGARSESHIYQCARCGLWYLTSGLQKR